MSMEPDSEPGSPELAARELDRLKELLIGPEKAEISELRQVVEGQEIEPRAVGAVLPDAILLRQGEDDRLADALAPTIEAAIQTSVQRDPSTLANAIFPLMGPAIRKSISQSLAAMVEGLNRTVEYSFTPRGLSWRLEALRTGRSFGEIVLLKSLVFRVEEVFLIHREGAILLEHVVAPTVVSRDPEMIASMLGVLHDYIHESFTVGEEQALEHVEFGDLVLEVVRGPKAILVATVRGTAPRSLRERMLETLEEIHAEKSRDLANFEGDTMPFVTTRPLLFDCLEEERRETKPNPMGKLILASACVVAMVLLVIYAFNVVNRRDRWRKAIAALESEPGLVLTTAREEDGGYVFAGLRDPLARDPLDLLQAEAGIDPANVSGEWEPYHALTPEMVLSRIQGLVPAPSTAEVSWADGRLTLSGRARHAWIVALRTVALAVSGELELDESALVDIDLEQAQAAAARLETQALRFPPGEGRLAADDPRLRPLLDAFRDLERAARQAEARVRVDLVAVQTEDGTASVPGLFLPRAEFLRSLLDQVSSGWARLVVSEESRVGDEVALRVRLDPAE